MAQSLNFLATRSGFNAALRHFKATTGFSKQVGSGANLADLLNRALAAGQIEQHQLGPALSALLVDKFGYAIKSHNLEQEIAEIAAIPDAIAEWTGIQLVLAYEHPNAGLFVINPRDLAQFEPALPLLRDELVVVYAGAVRGEVDPAVLSQAANDFLTILEGGSVEARKEYAGSGARAAAAPPPPPRPGTSAAASAAAAPSGAQRMTPRTGVLVTNELFHNGNVEAWKKIIESYRQKYQGLDVLIWYEGERINDINALFKWGKVKHGTPIMISVVGDNIQGVAKLKRYLFEGASPRFEMFLKGGVDRVLDLF